MAKASDNANTSVMINANNDTIANVIVNASDDTLTNISQNRKKRKSKRTRK
jgi:hypothetical protein